MELVSLYVSCCSVDVGINEKETDRYSRASEMSSYFERLHNIGRCVVINDMNGYGHGKSERKRCDFECWKRRNEARND